MAKYQGNVEPSTTDKNYISVKAGGYNRCIEIKNGSCLPNCVGYCWGKWRSYLGKDPALSRGNAENWYGFSDGYERGKTPRAGAVACWRSGKTGDGSDGYGHVAFVEKVNSDGSFVISQSNYGGKRWETKTVKKSGYLNSKLTFQGFIYFPEEIVEEKEFSEGVLLVAQEVLNGKYGNSPYRKENIYKEIQRGVNYLCKIKK